MFKIEKRPGFASEMHRIISNRNVLFNDGENDIVYTGTNRYGNLILGVIIADDDEDNFLRYIHVIIDDTQYVNFFSKRITLRNILETNQNFFIVDTKYNREERAYYLISFEELPEEYRPLQNSYCPNLIYSPSLEYSFSLQGSLSDFHKAIPEELNVINTKFEQFLRTSSEFVNRLDLGRNIFIEAGKDFQYGMVGSFKIKFSIEIQKPDQISLIEPPIDKIILFMNKYFGYVIDKLPEEANDIFKKDTVDSPEFKEVENLLTNIYQESRINIPAAGLEHQIIDLINYSLENFKNIDYSKGFERISLINYSSTGQEIPLGIIDKNFIPKLQNKLYKLEVENNEDVIEKDPIPKAYAIQVYWFSIESGKGGAYVNIDDKIHRIHLHVSGKKNYGNTVFTKSMDEGKIYQVNGIAKRVNGIIKELSVEL